MTEKPNGQADQLREACKISAATWAVWLEHSAGSWHFSLGHALNQRRQKELQQFIQDPLTASWLGGALGSGRTRSRATAAFAARLGCQRIYAFPNPKTHHILVAGADRLEKNTQDLFRLLSYTPPSETVSEPQFVDGYTETPLWPLQAGLESPYDPQHALESILEFLTAKLPCDMAYMAIRYGDSFHIQATWNCPSSLQGFDLPIHEDKALSEIVATRQGVILDDVHQEPEFSIRKRLKTISSWLGVPIQIGQRVIGIVAFAAQQPRIFTPPDLQAASQSVGRIAYRVENAIIFNEIARYLQQLALLNELASTASLGVESTSKSPADDERPRDEFARRVMQRLRRVFKTDWAAVLLLSPDNLTLHEYGGGSRSSPPWTVPVPTSLMGLAIETGQPLRMGDLRAAARIFPLHPDFRSELAVPLKYRGRVIGALVLVSKELNAFSQQDEQLLVVIASHMAGLFENMRLNEETRERAQKLADSVRQLQAVRDTSLDLAGDLDLDTLLTRLAQRARDLVDARGAELGLYNEEEQVVEIVVSETPWESLPGVKIPLMAGVAGQLAAFGEPLTVSDYTRWQGRLSPEQAAPYRVVAGVPLKFKGQVIGTLTVLDDRPEREFKSEDVQLLELLAPQAAISIRNARLYQELQERIRAQQLAEARLIRSARLAAVGEMAAGVAHELNNPLTTVTGFVELMLDELPADIPQHADLELVLAEAQRARGVVRRLLDFSRPVEDQRIRSDVNELVEQVLPLVQHLARTGGVLIRTELGDHLPWIALDPNQIKQVLLNLIHNGLQAMPSGGILTIRTRLEERPSTGNKLPWAMISVTDAGEGIPPEIQERLFEPFFSTRPAGKGTGLGLSVSYGIITSHGGFIDLESEVGKGSCFSVYLPVDPPEA